MTVFNRKNFQWWWFNMSLVIIAAMLHLETAFYLLSISLILRSMISPPTTYREKPSDPAA